MWQKILLSWWSHIAVKIWVVYTFGCITFDGLGSAIFLMTLASCFIGDVTRFLCGRRGKLVNVVYQKKTGKTSVHIIQALANKGEAHRTADDEG